MILLLFLASCVSAGFSYEREYGKEFKMLLLSTAQYIEFNRMDSSDQTLIVWKHNDPPDSRRKVEGNYFVIKKLTQLDSGHYVVRDKNGRKLSSKSLEVYEKKMTLIRSVTEELRVGFDLEPNSCNIYFFPEEAEEDEVRHTVARRGVHLETDYCQGLTLLWPCELENNNLEMSCSGRFEFRDLNDNEALVVTLIMESPPFNASYIATIVGIISAVLSCCCCCCCLRRKHKSSSEKDQSETPNDDEPAVYYHESENEPVGPRPEQFSPPSYTPTVPLIHNPPPTYDPPSFYEVFPPAQQEDVPTVPVLSDPEPRFEVKGLNFPSAPPLSSDSTGCDVYMSDKLNFL